MDKQPYNLEIITTSDGSHTLKLVGHNEQYHSVNGAINESLHVFIRSGLDVLLKNDRKLNILEIGFGTGLNALLTWQRAEWLKRSIFYHTLEPFPLDEKIVSQLNYADCFDDKDMKSIFNHMHSCQSDVSIELSTHFTFKKSFITVQDFHAEVEFYDGVYFDAFGPDTQAEMWVQEVFEKMYSLMRYNGVLVTYCAKGAVKRALKSAGFTVENLPGPPGKREITRAIKV